MHPEHRSIGELAYLLWQARGCPQGTAREDWLEAERQLREARAAERAPGSHAATERVVEESLVIDDPLRGTFPASDPPASHGPDKPPANAEEKWKAAAAARKRRPRTRTQQAKSDAKSDSKSDQSKPSNDALR
ncbi:MAG TPA: DUF2934 domain-containing protein [Steroidobacteraceae bacterium]|nr:DUF2934 domain-containing protein [Steroidobacteraceae bacterium]